MKRRIFRLALFLLLGAILNIGVVWGFAIWGGFHRAGRETPVEIITGKTRRLFAGYSMSRLDVPGATRVSVQRVYEIRGMPFVTSAPVERLIPEWGRPFIGLPALLDQQQPMQD